LTIRKGDEHRIGLFGGTFNPIHLGHLRGAEEVRESFGLRTVVFIPAALPPHKSPEEVAEVKHRLEMVRLAVTTNSSFSLSDVEIKRPGRSYSIDTIRHFREEYPEGHLYFILGGDAFTEIETWKEFRSLFSLCNFIVMARPGFWKTPLPAQLPEALKQVLRYDREVSGWVHNSGHTLHFQEITFLDISSTKVRELLERGESVRYLIPGEVGAYIRRYGLYGKKG
jgi:nicotinate-nucleotide adenylyltransferase